MSDENLKKLMQDKIYDALFSYAGKCHIENINDEINNEQNTNSNNSQQEEINDTVKKLIQAYNRKLIYEKFLKTAKNVFQRAAVILVVIFALSTILISSVDAFRVGFLNFFTDTKETYTKITVNEDIVLNSHNNKILMESADLKNNYIPAYIPDNFKMEKIIKQSDSVIILFKDSDLNNLVFEQSSNLNKEFMVDTEDAVSEKITFQGQDAIIIKKGKTVTMLWNNGIKMFNIYGQVCREEILKVAESVYKNN